MQSPSQAETTYVRRVHADTPDDAELSIGYIYTLLDPNNQPVYTGSCRDTKRRGQAACLARRFASHRTQAATDSTASPLYRAAGGSMEGWKIVHTRTVEWDGERCALALRKEEERIRTLLNHVFNSLHNVNRCVDPNEQRRLYMKRWREAHGQGTPDSYMARKAREARERRRALQNESGASGSEPLANALGASE